MKNSYKNIFLGLFLFLQLGISAAFAGPHNQAPTITLIPTYQTITTPFTTFLTAIVQDDGLPSPSHLTYTWSKIYGSGNVEFNRPASLNTKATFSSPGFYILQFAANDGQLNSTALAVISVSQVSSVSNQSSMVSYNIPKVLTLNGTGGGNSNLTFSIVSSPSHGTLGPITAATANSATVTYTPANGYMGNDSFSFQAYNGSTNSNAATFSISIERQILTYAIVQWSSGYSWNGNPPPHTGDHIVYPYVLFNGNSSVMDVHNAKAYVDQLPIAAIYSWDLEYALPNISDHLGFDPRDHCVNDPTVNCLWMDNWLSVVKPRAETFFRDYQAIGGHLDVFEMASEFGIFPQNILTQDPRYTQVSTNPLIQPTELIRGSMSQKFGNLNALTSANCANLCGDYWNKFAADWLTSYFNKGIYESIQTYFPSAKVGTFNIFQNDFVNWYTPYFSYADHCVPGVYCNPGVLFGNTQMVGVFYTWQVPANQYFDRNNPYLNTSFNGFKHHINVLKGSFLSNPLAPVTPVIAGKQVYLGHNGSHFPPPNPSFYEEGVFHSLSIGPPHVYLWTESNYYPADAYSLDAALDEFDRVVGPHRGTRIMDDTDWVEGIRTSGDRHSWAQDWVLTCIERDTSVINNPYNEVCRITPDRHPAAAGLPAITVESFLVSEQDSSGHPKLTFRTLQKTIEINGARIIRPINPVSNQGYWFEKELNTPIVFSPSGLYPHPTASISVFQDPLRPYEAIVVANNSHSNGGGQIARYDYVFDGNNNNFGQPVCVGDGGIMADPNINPHGTASYIWYWYGSPNCPVTPFNPPTHTIGLKVTDSNGTSTTVYTPPFAFSPTRPVCTTPGPIGGMYECPLASATQEP